MRGHQELIDAALLALDRFEQRQYLSGGADSQADVIRQLRRALIANGFRKDQLPLSAKRRLTASQKADSRKHSPAQADAQIEVSHTPTTVALATLALRRDECRDRSQRY